MICRKANSIMNIQDVKLYDTVRIKSNKCLYEYERRLIYAVTHIDMETKPDTVDIDVSDIKKVANTSNNPLYDYVRHNEQIAQKQSINFSENANRKTIPLVVLYNQRI